MYKKTRQKYWVRSVLQCVNPPFFVWNNIICSWLFLCLVVLLGPCQCFCFSRAPSLRQEGHQPVRSKWGIVWLAALAAAQVQSFTVSVSAAAPVCQAKSAELKNPGFSFLLAGHIPSWSYSQILSNNHWIIWGQSLLVLKHCFELWYCQNQYFHLCFQLTVIHLHVIFESETFTYRVTTACHWGRTLKRTSLYLSYS